MSDDREGCSNKKRLGLQTKLKVNQPGDSYEQEADRVADQVMAAPAHHTVSGAPIRIQRFSAQASGQMDAAPASVYRALARPGRPLEPNLRLDVEQRFGYDFSGVRIHTHADALESTARMNARAFTLGQDIFFREAEYRPNSQVGLKLLAHELTHVVQQKHGRQSEQIQRAPAGGSERPSIAGSSDEAMEMWKDVVAQRHFQQTTGEVTFSRMKILDKEGRTVVNILTESDKTLHAEEKAIRVARMQIGEGHTIEGGKIIFVTDQTVCPHAGRCRDQIRKFAEEVQVKEATATYISRTALPEEPGPIAGPKPTAKKVQRRVVEGLELTTSTETIYSRGETVPPKPTGGTSSGGRIKGKVPVATPAEATQVEIKVAPSTPPKPAPPTTAAPTPHHERNEPGLISRRPPRVGSKGSAELRTRSFANLEATLNRTRQTTARMLKYLQVINAFFAALGIVDMYKKATAMLAHGTAMPEEDAMANEILSNSSNAKTEVEKITDDISLSLWIVILDEAKRNEDVEMLKWIIDSTYSQSIELGKIRSSMQTASEQLSGEGERIKKASREAREEADRLAHPGRNPLSILETGLQGTLPIAEELFASLSLERISGTLSSAAENYEFAANTLGWYEDSLYNIGNTANDWDFELPRRQIRKEIKQRKQQK